LDRVAIDHRRLEQRWSSRQHFVRIRSGGRHVDKLYAVSVSDTLGAEVRRHRIACVESRDRERNGEACGAGASGKTGCGFAFAASVRRRGFGLGEMEKEEGV